MAVVVTGAAGAMGDAIVRAFAGRGMPVVGQDVCPLATSSEDLVGIEGDLRDRECLSRLRSAVDESGATAVIAAHGTFTGAGPLDGLELESVRHVLEVNFAVIPHLFEALRDALRARRGTFIVIASQAALKVEPGASTYAASKAAAVAWARTLDRELRDEGIRVRVICPGRTESPMLDAALAAGARAEGMAVVQYEEHCRRLIPAQRFGLPKEIAAAVDYLVTAGARPGVLAVNGGEVPW